MITIVTERAGTFSIDAHEVTYGEYAVIVAAVDAGKVIPSRPPRCATKTTFSPTTCTMPTSATLDHPIACVDWCDAFAYCAFAGKRLCGKIGGGPVEAAFPATAQWGTACSGALGLAYPYGPTVDDTACWTRRDAGAYPSRVATTSKCEGSAPGLFDMSGNVWEWEDECGPTDGGKDVCVFRGASIGDFASVASCTAQQSRPLDFTSYNIGFRCCADP